MYVLKSHLAFMMVYIAARLWEINKNIYEALKRVCDMHRTCDDANGKARRDTSEHKSLFIQNKTHSRPCKLGWPKWQKLNFFRFPAGIRKFVMK